MDLKSKIVYKLMDTSPNYKIGDMVFLIEESNIEMPACLSCGADGSKWVNDVVSGKVVDISFEIYAKANLSECRLRIKYELSNRSGFTDSSFLYPNKEAAQLEAKRLNGDCHKQDFYNGEEQGTGI